jgi:hypothetical protein
MMIGGAGKGFEQQENSTDSTSEGVQDRKIERERKRGRERGEIKWDEARSPVTSLNWTSSFPAIDPNQKSGPHFPSCPCLCARSQPASATVTAAHSTDKTGLRDWRMQRIKQLLLFSL